MSLTGEQWAFANYSDEDFKVIFVREPPEEKERYVYEFSSEYFNEVSPNQFVSNQKIPILKTHKFKTSELSSYWRMATKEEKDRKEFELQSKF